MDQVLEAVADAVAQLVMFSVEAEENNSILPDIVPGAQAVQGAVNALVDIASQMAQRYGSEPKIQQKMLEAATTIRGATQQIVNDATTLSRDQMSQQAKKSLLRSAKEVLQGTVSELHLADKYDVIKLVKAATLCKDDVQRSYGVTTADQIMDVARTLSANVVATVKLVNQRIAILVDPIFRRRLDTANEIAKNSIQSLVRAMGEVVKRPADATARAEQRRISREFEDAMDEIIEVARLSCKSMFEGLDLDFGLDPPARPTLLELRACHERIVREVGNLDAAANARTAEAAAHALHMINSAIMNEVRLATEIADSCAEDVHKINILEACDRVEKMPSELTPATKDTLRRAADPSAKARLETFEQQTIDASAAVVAAVALSSSAKDNLITIGREMDLHLTQLDDGVDEKNKAKAAKAAKNVADDVSNATMIATAIADAAEDPRTASAVRAEVDNINALAPGLINATKAAIAEPNNALAAAALHKETGAMREAKDRLIDAATLSPEELLAKRARELADELRKLEEAIRAGNLPEVAARLKAAKAKIADQLALARALAASCTDPVRRKELEAAIAELERLEAQLLPASKAALSGDKAALAELERLLTELGRVEQRLQDAAKPTPDEHLRQLNADVAENLALLADALARGDIAAARRATDAIRRALDKEIDLLRQLEEHETDPHRRRQLAEVRERLERLRPEFDAAANHALENPDDPAARAALDRVLRELEAAGRNMDRIFPSEDERMAQLADRIKRDLDQLHAAAQKGDSPATATAVKTAVSDVGQQLALASVLADKATDPLQKRKIQEEMGNVKALTPQLVQATKGYLASPNDPKSLEALRNAINDINAAVQALSAASTMPPEQQLVEQAAAISSALADLQQHAGQGDREATAVDNRLIFNAVPRQVDLLQQFVESQGDNPYQKALLEKEGAALKRLVPELLTVSTRVAGNPNDQAAKKQLAELVESAKSLNNALLSATTSPDDQILTTTSTVGQELQRLGKAVEERDLPATDASLKALKDAIAQEALVVRQLADKETDPQRKKDLLNAINSLEDLLSQLGLVAKAAATGDQRAKAQFDQMVRDMEAANNRIAELTTKPTKQLIAENAAQLHGNLNQLADSLNKGDKEAAKALLGATQKGLLKQQNLVKAQANRTTDPRQRKDLLAALHDLDRVLTDLPVSVRSAINNPADNPKALNDIRSAHGAVDKSVNAVKANEEFELLTVFNRITHNVNAVPHSVQTNNVPARNEQVKGIKAGIDEEKALVDQLRQRGDAKLDEGKVRGALADVDSSFKEFLQQVQVASAAPTSASELKKLADAGEKLKQHHVQLFHGILGDPAKLADAVIDTNYALDDSLDRLQAAVRRGNRQDATDALHDAVDNLEKQAVLTSLLADQTTDPKQKQALKALAQKFTDAKGRLTADTHQALAHPNDKAAQDKFHKTVQDTKALNAEAVVQSHADLERDIRNGQKAIADKMQAIMNALNAGDKETAERLLQELEKDLKKQAILCKVMAGRTTDPRKKKQFLDAAANLQSMLNQLGGPFRDLLMKKGGEKDAAEFMNKLFNDVFKVNQKIEDGLAEEKEEEEEPKDEIMQAARHVEKVVNMKEINADTAEGRIYLAARKIAEEMALMSQAAARGANSEVIVISRRIHALVGQVGTNSKAVADACKDPILRDQVMSITHAINNISVQLKIITAVKAAGGTTDNSVKAQLVKCAKGLASNVVNVCNAVEIASIRV